MIKVWQGDKFEYEHEIVAKKKITDICKNYFKNKYAHLVFSFTIQGNDFDCLIITPEMITVIELKKFDGYVSGYENGHWKVVYPDGREHTLFRLKNPFKQCLICRSKLNSELGKYFKNVEHKELAKYIHSGIIAYPKGELRQDGSVESIINNNPWFYYENISHFKEKILDINLNRRLPIELENVKGFIQKRLGCKIDIIEIANFRTSSLTTHSEEEKNSCVTAKTDTHSLVIAGPGSGKTDYVIKRAKYMIEDIDIPHDQLGFVSFSNESSDEIKRRLLKEIKLSNKGSFFCCGTIHNLCLQFLKENDNYKNIGYSRYPQIISEYQTKKRLLYYFKWLANISEDNARRLVDGFSIFLNREILQNNQLIEAFLQQSPYTKLTANKYISFINTFLDDLKSENLIEFDTMLLFANELLKDGKNCDSICKSIKYLFIDEFQDISRIQFDIFYKLASAGVIISAVGDPAQAIYGFRGGDNKAFAWFQEYLDEVNIFTLSYNHRSDKNIVKASDKFQSKYELYKGHSFGILNFVPISDKPGQIFVKHFDTETREANYIATEIRSLLDDNNNDLSFKDIAVLYRSKFAFNKNIELLLQRMEIPYHLKYNNKFSEKPHIRKILSVLQCIYSEYLRRSDIFWLHLTSPLNTILTYYKIIKPIIDRIMEENNSSVLNSDTIEKLYNSLTIIDGLSKDEINELEYLQNLLLLRTENKEPITKNILHFFEEIYPDIQTLREKLDDDIIMDVQKLIETAENFDTDFKSFQQKINIEYVEDISEPGITISTLHGAKGIEWSVVFIMGLIDGIFPSSIQQEHESQEDNLFYVGMTRAKTSLYLTYPEISSLRHCKPSPYYSDIEYFINSEGLCNDNE